MFSSAINTMLGKFCLCGRINRIAYAIPNFLCAGGSGSNVKLLCKTGLFYEILHDELSHWAATNIAVAHEKYRNHVYTSFHKSSNPYIYWGSRLL